MAFSVAGVVDAVVKFFGDVRVHRIAAGVAAVAVALTGSVTANSADLGLDEASLRSVVGIIGVVAAVAREVASPVVLPALFAIFDPNK